MGYHVTNLNFSMGAPEIKAEYEALRKEYVDMVGKARHATCKSKALALADGKAAWRSIQCILPALVSRDAEARSAGAEAKKNLSRMWAETYTDQELKKLLEGESSTSALAAAQLQWFEKYEMLTPEVLQCATTFERNINEDTTTIPLTEDELEGLPASFIANLPKDNEGRRLVGMKAPTRFPVMQHAVREETRRKVATASGLVCKESNGPVLKALLRHRHEQAVKMGYPNHAEAMLKHKMAGSLKEARAFCEQIVERMREKYKEEMDMLRAEKRALGGDGTVHKWDIAFLCERIRQRETNVSAEKLKEFFPLLPTMQRVFEVYEGLLGLRITKDNEAPRWDDDVMVYRLNDAETGEPLGHFYLDIFPRDGKYGHQMILPLSPSFTYPAPNGGTERCLPACCFMGNLTPPEGSKPAMLSHKEVQTLFHEFGHAMHCLCTKAEHSVWSWAWPMVPWPGGVEQDFLEVPSMMFEQWMKDPGVVRDVSGHYLDPSKKIDADVVAKLDGIDKKIKVVERDMMYYAMALADLAMHSGVVDDVQEVLASHVKSITGLEGTEGEDRCSSWYHPATGYDAGYYGYGWSEVYAHDLFSFFRSHGVYDKTTGRRLRELILAPCASKPARDMLESFLSRPPSIDAYLVENGLAVKRGGPGSEECAKRPR